MTPSPLPPHYSCIIKGFNSRFPSNCCRLLLPAETLLTISLLEEVHQIAAWIRVSECIKRFTENMIRRTSLPRMSLPCKTTTVFGFASLLNKMALLKRKHKSIFSSTAQFRHWLYTGITHDAASSKGKVSKESISGSSVFIPRTWAAVLNENFPWPHSWTVLTVFIFIEMI